MHDVTMVASRRRRSTWWRLWKFFLLEILFIQRCLVSFDHGRSGVMATAPSRFVFTALSGRTSRRRTTNHYCRNSRPTVTNPLNSIYAYIGNKYFTSKVIRSWVIEIPLYVSPIFIINIIICHIDPSKC